MQPTARRTEQLITWRAMQESRDVSLVKTKGCHNTKLNASCDGKWPTTDIHLTEGNASDYKGAEVLLERPPKWVKSLAAGTGLRWGLGL